MGKPMIHACGVKTKTGEKETKSNKGTRENILIASWERMNGDNEVLSDDLGATWR